LSLCSAGVVVVFWLPPFVAYSLIYIWLASPLLLNLALLFLLDSAVDCVEFGCCCCPTPLLVLCDLAVGFARSNCGFLVDSDPCSCWIGFLVCWTLIGPLFGRVLLLLWFLVCWSCSFVFLCWRSTQQPPLGFGLVFIGPVWCILRLSFVPLVWICFSWLGVQGGHSFEPIYWLFAVGDLFALLLTFPQTLVSYSSCLPRLL